MKLIYLGESISYDVDIAAIKINVIQALGASLIPKESGFTLIDDMGNEYDYSAYSTIYRTIEGGYQYSNNGEIWVEPTKEIIIQVFWNDNNDEEKKRPSSIKLDVFDNEEAIGTVTLNAKNNWTKKYENVPFSHNYTIMAPDCKGYEKYVMGTTVAYNLIYPEEEV